MTVVELDRPPSLPALYGRAAARFLSGRRRIRDQVPDTELVLRGVRADPARLAGYARVCGFRLTAAMPATFPHVLAFPLALRLMTAPDFPFPAAGVVHLANRIEQHRPLPVAEPLDLAVRAESLRGHPRGRQVDLVATASVAGQPVWRDVSTYLYRTGSSGARSDRGESPVTRQPTAIWQVPAGIGRAYAAVSGDRNPIHVSTLAARGFGFKRRIAHGMWTKARCLAQLAGRLPDAFTVEVSFESPLLLPATVAFTTTRVEQARRFWVQGLHNSRPHLSGEVRWPAAGGAGGEPQRSR